MEKCLSPAAATRVPTARPPAPPPARTTARLDGVARERTAPRSEPLHGKHLSSLRDKWVLLAASRLEDLRVKLENEGLVNISYVVVNHQSPHSQKKFHLLQESVSDHIAVYQQEDHQADVWTTLNGNKDDFLIYDRCGRLVYHLGLPYSFLSFQYVEEAIKIAYCENKCGNCSYTEPDVDYICENITKKEDENLAGIEPEPEPSAQHSHHHHQVHRHRHHHHREGGRHSKNQNHQAPPESQRRHPHNGRHHRVFNHNKHDQIGSHEQVETLPPGEGVEILPRVTKL